MPFLIRLLLLLGFGWMAYRLLEQERSSAAAPRLAGDLESRIAAQSAPEVGPATDDFVDALDAMIDKARARGAKYVDINAGKLHRLVGGYPGPGQRLAHCCMVMRSALRRGDMVLEEPRSGVGATLTLRYHLD